ncbi:MAG TPA: CHASE3 domain-containing protein [Streptosporangiaceae bacterium]|nr:CHASE3 domain-containing protein [Streptosporangiaceae bacterium]
MIAAAFTILALAIDDLRDSESRANRALEVLVAANRLERLTVEIQNSQRGYIITGERAFLEPWHDARSQFPQQAEQLRDLASPEDQGQSQRASEIQAAGVAYIESYARPLVALAERDLGAARSVAVTAQGQSLENALHARFKHFIARENQIFRAGQQVADAAATRALAAAGVSVAGSIALILFSGGYLARSVVRPVRRASAMAGVVAGGDLSVRMPETGPGEVGSLQQSFNSMTDSLAASRDELRRVADEQAALRRVATLVALGVPPPEVFHAVASETGCVLGANESLVVRSEPDGSASVAGVWKRPGSPGRPSSLGWRWVPSETSLAGRIKRTGKPIRVSSYDGAGPDSAASAREHGIRSSAGSPVVVEGQPWGMILAFFGADTPARPDDGVGQRLLAFTELVAMAVANTESRAQLAASRARVVAAADETRRRIERDLHDGTQQRLISLALGLRAAQARLPAGQQDVAAQWSRTAQGLTDAIQELREISSGLHPAVLEKRGLAPALRELVRRGSIPVTLDVQVSGRLPERVEVAAYYVVSEALTNAAKHSHATVINVETSVAGDVLRLVVTDDGAGGADPSRGSGLVGLGDRVEAAGGELEISSPPGRGTSLVATIPLRQI